MHTHTYMYMHFRYNLPTQTGITLHRYRLRPRSFAKLVPRWTRAPRSAELSESRCVLPVTHWCGGKVAFSEPSGKTWGERGDVSSTGRTQHDSNDGARTSRCRASLAVSRARLASKDAQRACNSTLATVSTEVLPVIARAQSGSGTCAPEQAGTPMVGRWHYFAPRSSSERAWVLIDRPSCQPTHASAHQAKAPRQRRWLGPACACMGMGYWRRFLGRTSF